MHSRDITSAVSGMLICVGFAASAPAAAAPIELLTNGDFEAGLASWTVTDQIGGIGSWFATGALSGPGSSLPTVGPAGGVLYAVSDQTGPGTHALTQSFLVPIGATSVTLGFDMFINDYGGGPIIDPAGLDFTAFPNQHARVDILSATASPFDTGAGVITNLFNGVVPGGSGPNPWTAYGFDISSFVPAGSSYVLRFAEVDNQGNFLHGVDNVMLQARVPEPATLTLLGLAFMGLAATRRKSQSR